MNWKLKYGPYDQLLCMLVMIHSTQRFTMTKVHVFAQAKFQAGKHSCCTLLATLWQFCSPSKCPFFIPFLPQCLMLITTCKCSTTRTKLWCGGKKSQKKQMGNGKSCQKLVLLLLNTSSLICQSHHQYIIHISSSSINIRSFTIK